MAPFKRVQRSPQKTRTSRPAQDVKQKIESPHAGKAPRKVGDAQTASEADDLRGIPGKGKVKQVGGPSAIRPSGAVGAPGSVKIVGGGNYADEVARNDPKVMAPGVRQPGAVKAVGPSDIGYTRLTEHPMSSEVETQLHRFRPKAGQRLDKGVPLLIGGVGRARAWARYAGSPGTLPLGGANGNKAFASNSLLINGRARAFEPEPWPARRDLSKPKSVVTPGGTRRFA